MADQKLTDLPQVTAVAANDKLYVDDVSDTTDSAAGSSKYCLASDFIKGNGAAETDQEAGTSNTLVVTPSVQQYHPSAAKAWVVFDGTASSPTPAASYGVSSITKNGTGDYTITWGTPFSSANYVVVPTAKFDSSSVDGNIPLVGMYRSAASASTFRLRTAVATAPSTGFDCNYIMIVAFGDQ